MSLCILEHGALPLGWPTPQIKLRRGGNVYQHGGFKYPNRQHDLVNAVGGSGHFSSQLLSHSQRSWTSCGTQSHNEIYWPSSAVDSDELGLEQQAHCRKFAIEWGSGAYFGMIIRIPSKSSSGRELNGVCRRAFKRSLLITVLSFS
jgi:hypothetical protein